MINSFEILDYNENPCKFDFIIEQSRQLFVIELNTISLVERPIFLNILNIRLWKEESFCYERI